MPTIGLADLLLDEATLAEVVQPTGYPLLDVVPPGDRLSACSDQMGGTSGLGHGREFRDPPGLKPVTGYDVVILDTSPVQTPLNVAILYAVGEVLIPIDPCVAALAGVRALEELIRGGERVPGRVHRRRAAHRSRGVLITRADRTLVSKQIEAEVRNYFGALVYEKVVPSSVKFREAYARGIPLVHYDRLGPGAEAYRAAARAFLGTDRRGRSRRSPARWRPIDADDFSDAFDDIEAA